MGQLLVEPLPFRPVTHDRDRGIRSFMWAHDNRHLLYIQDKGGDENWRIYDVDLDTGDIRDLTPFENVQARIDDMDKRFPNDVLVGLNKDNPQLHDVYHLDLTTGKLEKIVENPGFIGFLADADLQVRAGVAPTPDGGMLIMVVERGADPWAYWNTTTYWVVPRDFLTGIIKSAFFGVVVTLIGCYNGLSTEGGTEGLGRATTATVVHVTMGVIVADFFLTKLLLIVFW